MRVCIFAASSGRIDPAYNEAATELGGLLATAGMSVVYGGGGIGLMGKVADAVLEKGGEITGVIPSFMKDEGWGHPLVSDMIITADMGERKKKMFDLGDAVVALPGGIGTLEELTEAITLKQLSLYKGPVIIMNTLGYYDKFLKFLEHMIGGSFMRLEHKGIWEVVNSPQEVMKSLHSYDGWHEDWRKIAKIP